MKVGIVLHSQSGNTAAFAKIIGEKVKCNNIDYETELLRIQEGSRPSAGEVAFRRVPEISEFDTILFGAPVIRLKASPIIVSYIETLDSLKGKRVLPFVTYGFPWKLLGANQALESMSRKLDALCADVLEGESIFFFFGANKQKMDDAAERIVRRIRE